MTVSRIVVDSSGPLLAKLGFKKRAGDIFTIALEKDVLGWLGLNRATQHRPSGEVEINPVVGVRHQEVERLVAELRGEKFHAYQPPTISTPLGYLLPEARYRSWIFMPDCGPVVATDMVAAIAAHGLPFMRSLTSLEELCRGLEMPRAGFEHQLVYRRPVARFLFGDLTRAEALLNESLTAFGGRTDPAASEFNRFAVALHDRITYAASLSDRE